MKTNNFSYGSVLKLTRRDTIADIERHFSLMRDCGMDTVVVWPSSFWWEEKSEDYPFATGKKLLASAEKFGIKVIMELAGQLSVFEYIPDFLMKKEYHPTTPEGSREWGAEQFWLPQLLSSRGQQAYLRALQKDRRGIQRLFGTLRIRRFQ